MKRTVKTIGLATISTLLLAGCGFNRSNPDDNYTAHPYDAPPISESLKREFLDAVNKARSVGRSCGKYGFYHATKPLVWDDNLYRAAYEHSQDMAEASHYEHDGSGTNSDWTSVVQELGRPSYFYERAKNNKADYVWEENIAAGYHSTKVVVEGFLNSPGHCTGIMSPENNVFGMAKVTNTNSKYKVYWTQEFGQIE